MPRKPKKYHYLYKTTNLINNKFYVGMHSTNDLKDGYLGSGKYLRNSINKHGKENFKIEFLEFFNDRKKLKLKEETIVNEDFINDPLCMNLRKGGDGGFFSVEACRKGALSMNKINWNNPEFIERKKKVGSERFKEFHRIGKLKPVDWTGKKHSEKTLNKFKGHKRQVGEKNSQFGSCWIHNNKENKKIKKEELDFHLSNGWIKGRKMRV